MEAAELQKRVSQKGFHLRGSFSRKLFCSPSRLIFLFIFITPILWFSLNVFSGGRESYFNLSSSNSLKRLSQTCEILPVKSKKLVTWNPDPTKFLFMMCSGGQLSNRFICIRQNILDAILLNRTLIFPTSEIDYNYTNYLDFEALNTCFGRKIISFRKFYYMNKKNVIIKKNYCHVHPDEKMNAKKRNTTVTICEDVMYKYKKTLNVKFKKYEKIERREEKWVRYSTEEFLKKFNSDDDIITFSNMFGVGGEDIIPFVGKSPIQVPQDCPAIIQPSIPIQETAKSFVNWILGTKYIAIHFRRGDFFLHCLKGLAWTRPYPCWHPLPQIAKCIIHKLKLFPHLNVVYLATNAQDQELEYLKTFVHSEIPGLIMVTLPSPKRQQWARPLDEVKLSRDPVALSLVEKLICVYSTIFLGSSRSTFTEDIVLLRESYGLRNSCDDLICPLYEPADVIPLRQP